MKQTLFIVFLFLGILSARAQDKDWSVELNYPVSIGEDFGASNQGLFGLGLKYRFAQVGNWRLGASLDGTWFSTEFVADSDPPQISEVRDLLLQPRFFAALPLTQNEKLQLLGGLGWTLYRVSIEEFVGDEQVSDGTFWNNGLNLNAGLTYAISNSWFLAAQCDLIFLSGEAPDATAGLFKLGAGFRF